MGGWTKTGDNTYVSDTGEVITQTGDGNWTKSDGTNYTETGNGHWEIGGSAGTGHDEGWDGLDDWFDTGDDDE